MKPHYKLKTLNKLTDEKGNDIGAGWLNEDGSITIKLRPSVALIQVDNCVITLFPNDYDYVWNNNIPANKIDKG